MSTKLFFSEEAKENALKNKKARYKAPRKDNQDIAQRLCLTCDTKFKSKSNRICSECKRKVALLKNYDLRKKYEH